MRIELATDPIAPERRRLALGLGGDDKAWLAGLETPAADQQSALTLASGSELTELLDRLGFAAEDAAVVIEAAPDQGWDADLLWLLDRCARRVIAAVGRWGAEVGPWVELPARLGERGRCFWIYVFLAVVPAVRRWHLERRVPEDISWATLADLGRHVRRFRWRRGATGLGKDSLPWLSLHFTGGIFALGRLQFNPYRMPRTLTPLAPGEPSAPRSGARVLGVHIPEAGPLLPDACEASFRWARTFFGELFPEHPTETAVCSSWLLDDQLAEYLPPTSNILRFQGRFHLVQEARETNVDAVEFVFHRPLSDLQSLTPQTTLERAIVAHIRSGRTWRVGTGWLRLPE